MAIELLNIDCMEYMAGLEDNAFDLAIVDPPYGINAAKMQIAPHLTKSKNDGHDSVPSVGNVVKTKGRLNSGSGKLKNRLLNTSSIDWDNSVPTIEYFNELFRVSKNQIIWGGNYFDLKPTRCVVCWDKCQPWENFSQWEMAWTSFDKPASLYRYSNIGGANCETKIHPTQKPIKLYKFLINRYAKEGDKILDTHLGSGSSAIAAHNMSFGFVGCELNTNYYNAACKRFKEQTAQLKLL